MIHETSDPIPKTLTRDQVIEIRCYVGARQWRARLLKLLLAGTTLAVVLAAASLWLVKTSPDSNGQALNAWLWIMRVSLLGLAVSAVGAVTHVNAQVRKMKALMRAEGVHEAIIKYLEQAKLSELARYLPDRW